MSAQELHRRLIARGAQIGLATVYRNLQGLVELGSVTSILSADKELIYRVCEEDTHHHHLRCRICGATVAIESDSAEVWAAKVAKQYGYVDVSHTFDVVGVCPKCRTT
ncbi:MAG: transcriptional repressor [Actinomycetota bacterium]|nr:transcriptional repressor [Actinomycetota bacterium]